MTNQNDEHLAALERLLAKQRVLRRDPPGTPPEQAHGIYIEEAFGLIGPWTDDKSPRQAKAFGVLPVTGLDDDDIADDLGDHRDEGKPAVCVRIRLLEDHFEMKAGQEFKAFRMRESQWRPDSHMAVIDNDDPSTWFALSADQVEEISSGGEDAGRPET